MRQDRPIVVIDSYQSTRVTMEEVLRDYGYTVAARTPALTPQALAELRPALLIAELQRGNADGIMLLLDQLRQRDATREIAVVLTTTDIRLLYTLAEPLWHLGCATLVKPFDANHFLAHVRRVLGPHGSRRQVGRQVPLCI